MSPENGPDQIKDLLADWNGEVMPLAEVRVSVLDRAFLFGDAVYEVIRAYGGHFFHINDHLDRMKTSLASLSIEGVDTEEVGRRARALLAQSGIPDALVYIQATRGVAARTHYYPESYVPNILIYVQPFSDPYREERKTGVASVTHKDIRWGRNDIKATSLAANCMAAQYARSKGCLEVVFIDRDGYMTEGSHTSLFGIRDGKLLVAPSSANVLPGITKRQVLELARKSDVPIEEVRVREEEIYDLGEFFLAGTPEELISIVRVNDRLIGDGKPGPLVRALYQSFSSSIQLPSQLS
ncbi:MAG: aminotransferase class IV [Cyanobacteria bacterium HKST-UBA02]|nr:aminotransferase class IV [Cyanobacteria bacterium HKST-UBA02]